MFYEKISLIRENELKEYDLIKEFFLDEYNSHYIAFADDATKRNY